MAEPLAEGTHASSPDPEIAPAAPIAGAPPTEPAPERVVAPAPQQAAPERRPEHASANGGDSNDKWADRIANVIGGLVLLAIVFGVGYLIFNSGKGNELEIVASARRGEPAGTATSSTAASDWIIEGRVLDGGENVEGARVWAIVNDKGGQQFAPNPTSSGPDGTFSIPFIVRKSVGDSARDLLHSEAVIQGKKTGSGWGKVVKVGRSKISLDGTVLPTSVQHDYAILSLMLIVGWFAVSFVLAIFAPTFRGHWIKRSYYLSVVATFLLSLVIIMAFYLAIGALVKDPLATKGEVVTLGFVNIFKGNFLATGPGDPDLDLVVSLSSSPIAISEFPTPAPVARESGAEAQAETGAPAAGVRTAPAPRRNMTGQFGAPLWVIVLSVIGASLLTVTMLLQEIESPLDFAAVDSQALRKRIRNVVQQQVFILFAPLGGIFLYQGLLVADAAEQPLAVALAALGAGVSLNLLLARAVDAAGSVLNRNARRADPQPPAA